MDIFLNKDIRSIIHTFLDLPSLENLLAIPEYRLFVNERKWKKYVKKELGNKKKECKKEWSFHCRSPDLLRRKEQLHIRTRENLEMLEELGYRWTWKMNTWRVDRSPYRPAHDMMMDGVTKDGKRVKFWRHETKSDQSGSTFVLFPDVSRKRHALHELIPNYIYRRYGRCL